MKRALPFLAAAALLAGCGSDDGDGNGAASTQEVEIVATEFALEPSTVSLDSPGTYTFVFRNEGSATHALEVEGGGIEEETAEIGPGETAELTVELSEDGEYKLYCPVGNHKEQGMEGSLTVGAAAGGGGTTTEDTTTEDSGYGY
jgi:plastocyanin